MILGIDAFNIRAGGGLTHIVELLRAADPKIHGFDKVFIWGCAETLSKIEERDWLVKFNVEPLNRGLIFRILWEKFRVRKLAKEVNCSILFVPGGSDASGFKPLVTMSQNLLPFEWRELARYGVSLNAAKFLILRWSQVRSFRNANGVIFLTKYAQTTVLKITGDLYGKSIIIPHGISPRFFSSPRVQKPYVDFSRSKPCRLLYVSAIDLYKHQWNVVEAVAKLRSTGIPVVLDLVGPPGEGIPTLNKALNKFDSNRNFINYSGAIPYETLNKIYTEVDIGVFASSCENMPNILLEGMASGLPIACSEMGPMPEILGEAGTYFNPEDIQSIADALFKLIKSHKLRQEAAYLAYDRAQIYAWKRCADTTFNFLAQIGANHILRTES